MSFIHTHTYIVYDPNLNVGLQLRPLPNQKYIPRGMKDCIIPYKNNEMHFIPIKIGDKFIHITMKAEKVTEFYFDGRPYENNKYIYVVRIEGDQTNLFETEGKLDELVKKLFNSKEEK